MRAQATVAFLAVVLLAAGCASIIHGTHQMMGVTSTPPGATVSDNGVMLGKTPLTAELKRKLDHTIRIELVGYKPYEMRLSRKLSGWYIANILFGGVVGLIIDAANGAMYNLTPEAIATVLTPEQRAALNGDTLVIATTLQVDPSWQKIGQMERLQ